MDVVPVDADSLFLALVVIVPVEVGIDDDASLMTSWP